jgi:hypothetical protein
MHPIHATDSPFSEVREGVRQRLLTALAIGMGILGVTITSATALVLTVGR